MWPVGDVQMIVPSEIFLRYRSKGQPFPASFLMTARRFRQSVAVSCASNRAMGGDSVHVSGAASGRSGVQVIRISPPRLPGNCITENRRACPAAMSGHSPGPSRKVMLSYPVNLPSMGRPQLPMEGIVR